MSHHLSFLLLNGGWNSVPSRNGCCVCGVNAIHNESVCLCDDWPQWFHESALKVHIIHCVFSCHTCTSVLVEYGERCGVQHAMRGCECGHKAFVWFSSMPLCSHSSQFVLFVENHGVVWVHNAHVVYPPCCHTICFHQPTMVGVSSSNVWLLSTLSTCCGGGVVSQASHHHDWWYGLLLREEAHAFWVFEGWHRQDMPIWAVWKHQWFCWAWFVSEMCLWMKAVALAPVSSITHFFNAQAQSSVLHSACFHKSHFSVICNVLDKCVRVDFCGICYQENSSREKKRV